MIHEQIPFSQLLNDQLRCGFRKFARQSFAFTNLKEVCNSNDENPNRNIGIQKIPLPRIACSPDKNIRAEKRDNTNWSKMR